MIVISGSSGLIGGALATAFRDRGESVLRLVRRPTHGTDESQWNPERGVIDRGALGLADVVINLAGENIAQRWTTAARRRIRDSRLRSTELIARTIAGEATKPKLLISGSAIGIYGNRGDEELDETSTLGDDFLASLCKEWEAATAPAAGAGVRVVTMRTGIVLARAGGALHKMIPAFQLGVGGRAGSGRQWMSWISLGDVVRAIVHIIDDEGVTGPVNLVGPNPMRNVEFAHTLARVLHRPALVAAPKAALKLLFGRMGEETLLASQRVRPQRLIARRFEFAHPTLEGALRAELSWESRGPARR